MSLEHTSSHTLTTMSLCTSLYTTSRGNSHTTGFSTYLSAQDESETVTDTVDIKLVIYNVMYLINKMGHTYKRKSTK